jgi:hypothetical protein
MFFLYFDSISILTCSHISGLFYRTIRMMVAGLKPVYVFDGKAPELKSGEVRSGSIELKLVSEFSYFVLLMRL